MPRRSVSPEIKAAALADLHAGEQPAVIAERYGVNAATVRSWKLRLDQEGEGVATDADATPVATDHAPAVATRQPARIRQPALEARQQTLAELVEANLRAKLIATQRIAEHVTRDEWLNKQSAADVGELFEALDRSAIGILDRLAAAHAGQRALPAPGDDGAASG